MTFRKNQSISAEIPVKFGFGSERFSAKMPGNRRARSKDKKAIDTLLEKPGKGRPGVPAEEVLGRAESYRIIFEHLVHDSEAPLLRARTTEEVISVLKEWPTFLSQFASIADVVLQVMQERKFPKTRDAQVKFLADSLAARGEITPRSSRDLCERQRAKEKTRHHIIRYEFYIACSCGFEGPSLHHSCPKCGAPIPIGLNQLH